METLWRIARTLSIRGGRGKALPPLLFFTDPARTPDIAAVMARLPRGAGIVWRPFGAPGRIREGRRLCALARSRRLVFLAGADPALAQAVRAHGVHLPERLARLAAPLRRRHPRWLVTTAAHSRRALRRAAGADAAVVSPVFESRSPSAGTAIGPRRLAAWSRGAPLPVYALGGINHANARRLGGVVGIAAIEALLDGSSGARR